MPMPATQIESLIVSAFPDAQIELIDTAGDQDHYSLTVISEDFRGKSRIEQHKMVYAALQGSMTTTLHALQVKTGIPS
jgi:stress-induced morphogen